MEESITTLIGTLQVPTQQNITSIGTLTELKVDGISTFSTVVAEQSFLPQINIPSYSRNPINLGIDAGKISQQIDSISIGYNAGYFDQKSNSIAIGFQSGYTNQGQNAIAIGFESGKTNQASGSIVIGNGTGSVYNNSIVLNGSGNELTASAANATFIYPIRNNNVANLLGYNTTTKEITYFQTPSSTLNVESYQIFVGATQAVALNTNYIIKWTGSVIGSMTGLSYNSTTGIFTLSEPGLYFFYISVRWNGGSGQKIIWFPNSVDAGTTITTSNFNTVIRYANYQYITINALLGFSYNLKITGSTTFAVAFFQSADANGNIRGTVANPTTPTNLKIIRIF